MIGYNVGGLTTTGSNNIYIDGNGLSPANESNAIRIGNTQTTCFVQGIRGVSVPGGLNVFCRPDGQLGTSTSSIRFKHDVEKMGDVSEKIYELNPVSFVYNMDETNSIQYGLIAEEVDAVLPELVAYEEDGTPLTVRYEVLPVLLLNEMHKQKAEIELQKVMLENHDIIISQLMKEIGELRSAR
jgi:hypothetical protein